MSLSKRSPAAAVVVDRFDRIVMANTWSIPVLRDLFGLPDNARVFGEVPESFKAQLRILRSAPRVANASLILHITPELCVRAAPLHDGMREMLLLLFEPVKRRSGVAHNLKRYGLTPREQDVAMQVLYGLSNRTIANRLSMAENTVEAHIKRLLMKAGATSRAAFVSRILGWPTEEEAAAGSRASDR